MIFRRSFSAENMMRSMCGGVSGVHIYVCRTGRGWNYSIVQNARGSWSGMASRTGDQSDKVPIGGVGATFRTREDVERECRSHLNKWRTR